MAISIHFDGLLETISKACLVKKVLVRALQALQNRHLSHLPSRGCFGSPTRPLPAPSITGLLAACTS